MMNNKHKIALVGMVSLLMTSAAIPAHAKLLSPWIQAKAANSGGTSDLFVYFDGPFAGGLEAGVEFLNIDVFGEALLMELNSICLPGILDLISTLETAFGWNLAYSLGPLRFIFRRKFQRVVASIGMC